MAVFWVVAPCSLVEVYQRFRGPCCLLLQGKDLWNVGKLLPDYTALQPRTQPSSYSPPWEPQILLRFKLSRIWGFHGGENEDGCLLGCSTVTTRCYNPEDSHLHVLNCSLICGHGAFKTRGKEYFFEADFLNQEKSFRLTCLYPRCLICNRSHHWNHLVAIYLEFKLL
jgi:hypothetical protein